MLRLSGVSLPAELQGLSTFPVGVGIVLCRALVRSFTIFCCCPAFRFRIKKCLEVQVGYRHLRRQVLCATHRPGRLRRPSFGLSSMRTGKELCHGICSRRMLLHWAPISDMEFSRPRCFIIPGFIYRCLGLDTVVYMNGHVHSKARHWAPAASASQ